MARIFNAPVAAPVLPRPAERAGIGLARAEPRATSAVASASTRVQLVRFVLFDDAAFDAFSQAAGIDG